MCHGYDELTSKSCCVFEVAVLEDEVSSMFFFFSTPQGERGKSVFSNL